MKIPNESPDTPPQVPDPLAITWKDLLYALAILTITYPLLVALLLIGPHP
ncbi:hypothetical protein [Corynebacterium humireducens]|nr:hypothetical protein [Corynebacterium humireducens]